MQTTLPVSVARDVTPRYDSLVAESPAMRRLLHRAERVALTEVPVLLTGESGTGKEVVSRHIHAVSGRHGAFVAVNCAGLNAGLADRELFGHVRGTFTGAERDARGLCQAAGGGTLFLDEVGELEPAVQAKLLRLLADGEIRRIGATSTEHMSARVIAATNRDLAEAVLAGRFREDLYYRLAGVSLQVPPLRVRREEIPLLIERFMGEFSPSAKRANLPATAVRALVAYNWPGNIRELRQAVARALIFGGDTLTIEDFDLSGPSALELSVRPLRSWRELERAAIAEALDQHGTIRGAAEALGRPRSTIADSARRYGLKSPGVRVR